MGDRGGPREETIRNARAGRSSALGEIASFLQADIYSLAVRMLGDDDDAADATQEILMRIVGGFDRFRGDSSLKTWAYRIATNYLLSAAQRARNRRTRTFSELASRLAEGLRASKDADPALRLPSSAPMPSERVEAYELGMHCVSGMLQCLAPQQRLAYLVDVTLGLPTAESASLLELDPATYRQRLSRARRRLHGFMRANCGLVDADRACRCHVQVRAKRRAGGGQSASRHPEAVRVARLYDDLLALQSAAAVVRSLPDPRAPERILDRLRAALG